jgi:hypothetical protein
MVRNRRNKEGQAYLRKSRRHLLFSVPNNKLATGEMARWRVRYNNCCLFQDIKGEGFPRIMGVRLVRTTKIAGKHEASIFQIE